jgi:hypothetical protein
MKLLRNNFLLNMRWSFASVFLPICRTYLLLKLNFHTWFWKKALLSLTANLWLIQLRLSVDRPHSVKLWNGRWIGKYLEGNGTCLSETLSWNFSGETEKKGKRTQLREQLLWPRSKQTTSRIRVQNIIITMSLSGSWIRVSITGVRVVVTDNERSDSLPCKSPSAGSFLRPKMFAKLFKLTRSIMQ